MSLTKTFAVAVILLFTGLFFVLLREGIFFHNQSEVVVGERAELRLSKLSLPRNNSPLGEGLAEVTTVALPTLEVKALDLLAKFEISRDQSYLEEARSRYPLDTNVLKLLVLQQQHPDEKLLQLIEQLEPNNALPNLLRAGSYATNGNIQQLKGELYKALAKSDLDIGSMERKAAVVDIILANPQLNLEGTIERRPEAAFFRNAIKPVSQLLLRAPSALGEEFKSGDLILWLADMTRVVSINDHVLGVLATSMEFDHLLSMPQDAPYNSSGVTVSERMTALNGMTETSDRRGRTERRIYAPDSPSDLVKSYLIRVRADGEAAALDYFAVRFGYGSSK